MNSVLEMSVPETITVATDKGIFRFGEVIEICGCTRNMLKRWHQIGLIVAAHSGSGWQRFSFWNLVEVRTCVELRALGITESAVSSMLKQLRPAGTNEVLQFQADKKGNLVDTRSQPASGVASVVISMSRIVREVREAASLGIACESTEAHSK